MKFYKREYLSTLSPMDNKWAVETDGRIVTDTSASLQLPSGSTVQRPTVLQNGEIRYNTDLGVGGDIEAYIDGSWQQIKTNRQQNITQQTFTNSDYLNTIFGPLAYDVNISSPQSVMVYVDNVYQIPTTNYTLKQSTPSSLLSTSTTVLQFVPFGGTVLHLDSVKDFSVGQRIDGTNLTGNTVNAVDVAGKTITIFPGALGGITPGGLCVGYFSTGTYIVFSEDAVPTPSKPITALLGFDGYNPPFEV
jgi:hypothetical protein